MQGNGHLSDSTAVGEKKAIGTVKTDDLTVVAMEGRLLGGNGSKGSGEWLRNDLNGDAQGIDRHTKCNRQKCVSNEWQKMGAKAEPMTAGKSIEEPYINK